MFRLLLSLSKGSSSDDAVFESHGIAVGGVSCKWNDLTLVFDSMDLTNGVSHELRCGWYIKTTVLHDLLSLV